MNGAHFQIRSFKMEWMEYVQVLPLKENAVLGWSKYHV